MSVSPTSKTKFIVCLREHGRCFRCGIQVLTIDNKKIVAWKQFSIHHRKPRGMGGTRDTAINGESNLLLLCGTGTTGCHGWVESHREEAKTTGLLLSTWDDFTRPAYSDYRHEFITL